MSFFSMPKVYVIPPEEDECPPFCCFDAAQSIPYAPTQADLDAPGSALDIVYHIMPSATDAPTFYRRDIHSTDVVMPRRRAIVDHNDITIRGNSPGDDSEIIEVIKVRRNSEFQPVTDSASKQSKGFKARASRAFNSIRNVGRSASRSRKEDLQEMDDSESTRAPSPTPMSRRPSMILTNLFSRSPSLRTSSSFDSFAESSSPSSPASPLPTPPDTISASSLSIQIHNPPSADMHSFVPCSGDTEDDEDEVYDPDYDDPQATPRANRPMSPSQASKSGRRRFSVMNLFSLASSQPVVATSPSTPTLPVMSRDSTDPSSESSSSTSTSSTGPPTPIDEPFPPPRTSTSSSLLKRVTSFSKRKEGVRKSQSLDLEPQSDPVVAIPQTVNEADLSFGEMRLDSLHFSELSFDADKFEVRS